MSRTCNVLATEQRVVLIEGAVLRLRVLSLLGTFYMPREGDREKEDRSRRDAFEPHELTTGERK